MKKILLALFVITSSNYIKAQGFTSPALQWNIPIVTDDSDYRASYDYHQLIDMDGDGKIDLVDTENQATESIADVFMNGSQKYWKVYLNNSPNLGNSEFEGITNHITIYPNPVKDVLNIDFNTGTASCEIFDMQGKMVLKLASGNTQFNVSNLPKGIYTLEITDLGQTKTYKIIKE